MEEVKERKGEEGLYAEPRGKAGGGESGVVVERLPLREGRGGAVYAEKKIRVAGKKRVKRREGKRKGKDTLGRRDEKRGN